MTFPRLAAGAALAALLLIAGLTLRGRSAAREAAREESDRTEAIRREREQTDEARRVAAKAAHDAEEAERKAQRPAPVEAGATAKPDSTDYSELVRQQGGVGGENNDVLLRNENLNKQLGEEKAQREAEARKRVPHDEPPAAEPRK